MRVNNIKKVVIVSGGQENSIETAVKNVFGGESPFIIACDKGLEYCRRQNVEPDLILGDFDSFAGEIPHGAIVLPCEKDDTDTMYALKKALEMGAEEVLLTCASGGRIDHLFCNLQTLVYGKEHGVEIYLADEKNMVLIMKNETKVFPRKEGFFLSVFSVSDRAENVTIRGAKYNVTDWEFTNRFPLGQSNEWASEEITISVKTGLLLISISQN